MNLRKKLFTAAALLGVVASLCTFAGTASASSTASAAMSTPMLTLSTHVAATAETNGACGGGQTFDAAVAGWKAKGVLDDVMRWSGVDPNGADGNPIDQLRKTLVHVQVARGSASVSNNTCGSGMFQPLAKAASQAAGTFIWTTREKIHKDGSVHEWFAADCGNLRGGTVFVVMTHVSKTTGTSSAGCTITGVHVTTGPNSQVNVNCGPASNTNSCSNANNRSTNCAPAASSPAAKKKVAFKYTCQPVKFTISNLTVTVTSTVLATSSPSQAMSSQTFNWGDNSGVVKSAHTYAAAGTYKVWNYTTFKNGFRKGCFFNVTVPPVQQQQQQQGSGSQQQQQTGGQQQQQQQGGTGTSSSSSTTTGAQQQQQQQQGTGGGQQQQQQQQACIGANACSTTTTTPAPQHSTQISCKGFEEVSGNGSFIVQCAVSDDNGAPISLTANSNDNNSRVSGINCSSQGGNASCQGNGTYEFRVSGVNNGKTVLYSSVTAVATANGVSATYNSGAFPVDPSSGGF